MPRILAIALLVVACNASGNHETTRTTTDTAVTPVKATDTTVVQKQVETKVDTLKKTHNKP